MRTTSVEAYRELRDSGKLGRMQWRMQWRVYELVYKHGPATSGEIFARFPRTDTSPISQSRARFTELRKMGLLKEVGKRKCAVSGRQAMVWDVTDNREPLPIVKHVCPLCGHERSAG